MTVQKNFAILSKTSRIWAVGSIHGNLFGLCAIHDKIAERICDGDKIIYLGNYFGYGDDILSTLEEIFRFRCWFLSIPPLTTCGDIIFLRGRQEEMWQKMRQLHFAHKPIDILNWACDNGIDKTLNAFNISIEEGYSLAGEGTLSLTQWTRKLKETSHAVAGHDDFLASLKHAVISEDKKLLFLNSGVDITKNLSTQTDSLWWSGRNFNLINKPYSGFLRIIRGYDPIHQGFIEKTYTLSLDAGDPIENKPIAICLSEDGIVQDIVTAD